MISIFFCVLILLAITSSAGFTFFSLLQNTPRNPFLAFFAGVFLFSLLAMAVSLVTPLTPQYSLLCLSPALFGLKQLHRLFIFPTRQPGRQILLLTFILAIAGACALGASYAAWANAYDTDLYHIQVVRWLNEYGTPFGIGNLHSRLANSSIWPIFAALLNHSILQDSIPWIMMPTFITAFTMYFVYDFIDNKCRAASVYALCMFPVCVYSIAFWDFPNLYHDFPSLAVLCISGAELLQMFFSRQNITLTSAISTITCITLSFLIKPLSAVSIILIPPIVLTYCHSISKLTFRTTLKILLFPFFAAVLWCIRNIVTSGYPFFPLSVLPLGADWTMTLPDVISNATAVRAWARIPGPGSQEAFEIGVSFWFLPWIKALFSSKQAIVTMLPPLIAGCACWYLVRKQFFSFKPLCLFVWSLLSILYWFWMAPDPRFGREFFWLFFAMGAACMAQYWPFAEASFSNNAIKYMDKQRYLYIVAVIFLMFACSAISLKPRLQGNSVALVSMGTINSRPTKLVTYESGEAPFDVYIPLDGDDRCGNAPLPCAPSIPQHIIRRDAKNLGAGFRPKLHQP